MINLFKLAALAKAASKPVSMPEVAADKIAQEQMTRRAALRRIGMTGAMTVIGVMSIDDLARISAKKLGEHEMTRGIASDFRKAGVAFADTLGNPASGSSNACRTQAGMNYSNCMMDATMGMMTAIQSMDPAALVGLTNALNGGNFDPNLVSGPLGQAFSDYNSAMGQCQATHETTLTVCRTNPGSTPLPFDPTVCQDTVDKNLEDTLKGKLWTDPQGAADALQDDLSACANKFPSGSADLSECCKDAVSSNALPNGGKPVSPLAVKVYLECSYIACDSGIGPSDPRNNCSLA